MLPIRSFVVSLLLTLGVCTLATAKDDQPTATLPYTPGLDVSAMDRTADPCTDFYQYACGGWIRNNPIPADQSRWSTYGKAYVDNQRYLWGILRDAAKDKQQRNATQTLIGDYFAACMDVAGIEKRGSTPLDSDLRAIDGLADKQQLGALIGRLIRHTDGRAFFLGLGSEQDAKDSNMMIGGIHAGGLGLPDRDYYFATDKNNAATRTRFITENLYTKSHNWRLPSTGPLCSAR